MNYPLPPDFTALRQAEEIRGTNVNLIGVVVDYQPPAPTKGTRKRHESNRVKLNISFAANPLPQTGSLQLASKTHRG
jgi:hypothetical protein